MPETMHRIFAVRKPLMNIPGVSGQPGTTPEMSIAVCVPSEFQHLPHSLSEDSLEKNPAAQHGDASPGRLHLRKGLAHRQS